MGPTMFSFLLLSSRLVIYCLWLPAHHLPSCVRFEDICFTCLYSETSKTMGLSKFPHFKLSTWGIVTPTGLTLVRSPRSTHEGWPWAVLLSQYIPFSLPASTTQLTAATFTSFLLKIHLNSVSPTIYNEFLCFSKKCCYSFNRLHECADLRVILTF